MSGGFKFYHRPLPYPQAVGRKCIVCGTTRHEYHMKPFMLKGDKLNLWVNNYFASKRNRLFNFYAKLRYTINPYACVEHFRDVATLAAPTPPLPKVFNNIGKRLVSDLLAEGEEPPSIERITEKKPTPPPEPAKPKRTQQEITDAVMEILKKAREEMDKEEERKKTLKKISRKILRGERGSLSFKEAAARLAKRRKREERERRRQERRERRATKKEKRAPSDGNEADSDESTIDVEGIDSSEEEEEKSSESSDSYEETDEETLASIPADQLPHPQPPRAKFVPGRPLPAGFRGPTVVMPRVRSYNIAAPQHLRVQQLQGQLHHQRPKMHISPSGSLIMQVPKRLTAMPAKLDRPSWVHASPTQRSLASVLQRFWNEESAQQQPLIARSSVPRLLDRLPRRDPHAPPGKFGRPALAGPRIKFKPASLVSPSLAAANQNPTTTSSTTPSSHPSVHHPLIRQRALLYNPPLSPSRLIVASEEEVVTTEDCEEKEIDFSTSSESESSDDSVLDVCDHAGAKEPVVGTKIEGELEEKSVRSPRVSTSGDSSDDVDVETVSECSDKREKRRDVATTMTTPPSQDQTEDPAAMEQEDEEKHLMSPHTTHRPCQVKYGLAVMMQNRRIIAPPVAAMKPPTRLLSNAHYSMRELLHAQARASAAQPVRIDTTGLLGAVTRRVPRPTDMPRLHNEVRHKRQSEWARLEQVVSRKLAEQKARKDAERKARQASLVDPQVMSENPPPELERVESCQNKKKRRARVDGFPAAVVQSECQTRRCKVLRMRFHKKKDAAVVSNLKVLDPPNCPLGVGLEVEVADSAHPPDAPPLIDKIEHAVNEEMSMKRKRWNEQERKEMKPPTRLLSDSHYSMRELLHAQARATAAQPVRIDTTGLLGAVTSRVPRPTDMPRLHNEVRHKRQSEWARLEQVVSRKLAEEKARKDAERKARQASLVDPQVMSENPPPELERVDNCKKTEKKKRRGRRARVDPVPAAVVETLTKCPTRRCKVLRMRFHKKKDAVVGSNLKVLNPPNCPVGVGLEVEVKDSALPSDAPPLIEKMSKKRKRRVEQERKRANVHAIDGAPRSKRTRTAMTRWSPSPS